MPSHYLSVADPIQPRFQRAALKHDSGEKSSLEVSFTHGKHHEEEGGLLAFIQFQKSTLCSIRFSWMLSCFILIISLGTPRLSCVRPGDSDPDEEGDGSGWEVPGESIESDMELKLHVLGFKALWSQTSPQLCC